MKKHTTVSTRVLLYILLFFALINFIGWLTKPDNYQPRLYPSTESSNTMKEIPKDG